MENQFLICYPGFWKRVSFFPMKQSRSPPQNIFVFLFLPVYASSARQTCKEKNTVCLPIIIESMLHGQVISLLNRSRELSKEAYLNELEKSSTVVIMQAKNIRTLNVTYVNEKKATKNN
jgi:hypothetical protein